jgi:adenylylsulfate reductase subunit B
VSIKISAQQCIGCGQCAEVCPGSLIVLRDSKAAIPRPERCWGCASCVKECPAGAILFYLGTDMGGQGGTLSVRRERHLLHWTVSKPDGGRVSITLDSRDSNKY